MKQFVGKYRLLWILLGTVLVAGFITAISCIHNSEIYERDITSKTLSLYASFTDDAVGELVRGNYAEQTFLATDDTITSISIGFALYDRKNKGTVTVELWDTQNNRIVETWNKKVSRLSGYYHTDFVLQHPETEAKNKEYKVKVYSSDSKFGEGVSVFYRKGNSYKDGSFYYNGKQIKGNMMLMVTFELEQPIHYKNTKCIFHMGLCVWAYLLAIGIILWFVIKCIKYVFIYRKQIIGVLKEKWFWGIVGIILTVAFAMAFGLEWLLHGKIGWNWVYFLWICLFVTSGVCTYKCLKERNHMPEHLFLIVALTVGGALTLSLPISTSIAFDDDIHYGTVSSFSHLLIDSRTNADYYMADRLYLEQYDLKDYKDNWRELNSLYYGKDNIYSKSVRDYSGFPYNRLAYFPAAIAHATGRMLHLPFTVIFIMGRLANLLTYTVIVYYGLERMRSGKYILLSVALVPICMYQASNYTYDYWLNAWMFYGVACVFGILQQKEKVTNWQLGTMVAGFAIGVSPKAVYVPLLLLVFLLPKKVFASVKQRRRFYIAVGIVTLAVLGTFLIPFLSYGPGVGDLRGGENVNATLQVKYIFEHPWQYTRILLHFLFGEYLTIGNIAWNTNRMGYMDDSFFGAICLLFMVLAVCLDGPVEKQWGWRSRSFIWLLLFGTLCVVATVMYISYTEVASTEIMGCQGRYLIPFLFPAIYAFGHHKVVIWCRKQISYKLWEKFFWYGSVIVLFVTCFVSYIYQYN